MYRGSVPSLFRAFVIRMVEIAFQFPQSDRKGNCAALGNAIRSRKRESTKARKVVVAVTLGEGASMAVQLNKAG